jgi:hypothetical protein
LPLLLLSPISILTELLLRVVSMGKRGSTAAGAAAKKAKTADADTSVVGNWVQTKIGDRELSHAEKMGLLKNDPAESLAAGPEIVPRPPPGFRVIFLALCCGDYLFPRTLFFAGSFSHMGLSFMI